MTRKILERLKKDNKNVYKHIEELKRNYCNSNNCELARERTSEYLKALVHVELITDIERRFLFCYISL